MGSIPGSLSHLGIHDIRIQRICSSHGILTTLALMSLALDSHGIYLYGFLYRCLFSFVQRIRSNGRVIPSHENIHLS